MKKLRISLTAMLFAIILTVSTGVFAYGSQVDTLDGITMPSSLTNGEGTVSTSLTGEMSYQFVKITQEQYAKYKKYEAQYNLIKAYIKQDSNYDSMASNYEKTYKQTANGIMDEYGIQFNEEGLNALRNQWIADMVTYSESAWIKSTDLKIKLDLTTFEGTQYYIGWVKIGTTVDAEVYKVTGTKSNNGEKPTTPTEPSTPLTPTEPTTPGSTTSGDKTSTTNKDTTATAKTIPYAGTSNMLIGLIVITSAIAGISYIRYRKIK